MSFVLPLRWLRSLALALRRWMGSVRAGRSAWECHRGSLRGEATFRLLIPPSRPKTIPAAPRLTPADVAALETWLELPRQRLLSGEPLLALTNAARLGAVLVAQLEEASPERRPAVLRVGADR